MRLVSDSTAEDGRTGFKSEDATFPSLIPGDLLYV